MKGISRQGDIDGFSAAREMAEFVEGPASVL